MDLKAQIEQLTLQIGNLDETIKGLRANRKELNKRRNAFLKLEEKAKAIQNSIVVK